MRELHDGDRLVGNRVLVHEEHPEYHVSGGSHGGVQAYVGIVGYQEHDLLLTHDKHLFCPDCEAETMCLGGDFPYVRMMKEITNECEPTERFK